ESIEEGKPIIFGPDRYLGGWTATQTGRDLILWDGYCPTHQKILPEHIGLLREEYPGAVVMAHPEVNPSTATEADIILGTGAMIRHAGENPAKDPGTAIFTLDRMAGP
ncbi:MAG: quinolinate synthase NadA, partial [Anaerolineales bacterium]|nr:quinolinate synthase NadA [Anaerolineales bacterium]